MIDLSNFAGEVRCTIHAPAPVVYDLLTDLSLTPEINRETVEAVWVPPSTGWAVGSTFRATNRAADAEWTVECHVTVAERGQEASWTVLDPGHPSSTWWYRLTSVGDSTEVVQGFQHGPGQSGVRSMIDSDPDRADEIVARRIEMLTANMAFTLDAVRRRAEEAVRGA